MEREDALQKAKEEREATTKAEDRIIEADRVAAEIKAAKEAAERKIKAAKEAAERKRKAEREAAERKAAR